MKTADEELNTAVTRALKDDPRVANAALEVRVCGGVVSLTGTVSSWGVKMAAQEVARCVPGSTDVRNGITFRMGEGARLTDADVARAVRRVLQRDLPGLEPGICCTVSAGWVTLEGAVDHWKQRGDVEGAVRGLPGVLGVASQLEVRVGVPPQGDFWHVGVPG
ncbi:MAG: BON domain-containing protein [Chromatiales bacterium]|nr:BON domain-containing protein [Chromatiales bacterium]